MATSILKASGIYAIVNKVNGKRYVGSAVNLRNRWKVHKSALNSGRHHSKRLQSSWLKNGEAAFSFEVLELVEKDALIAREQHWIDELGVVGWNGYNVSPTAGNCLGVTHSEATKAARSRSLIGRPRPEQVKQQISLTKRQKTAEEQALITAKVASALRARTPEAKAESAARAVETKRANGTLKSRPEAIEKQRAAISGRKLSPEVIARRSATVRENARLRREAGETRKYVRHT